MAGAQLESYWAKRRFTTTPEPQGTLGAPNESPRWVIQQHAARRMHYDFRLEADGALISWAVPKGPSYDPGTKRLAVKVEDHPLDYRNFEGVIPKGNYGAGRVIVWDQGTYLNLTEREGKLVPVRQAVEAGHVSFWLQGKKLIGGWSLTRFDGDNWALVKRNDEYADRERDVTASSPESVKTGRTINDVDKGEVGGEDVWSRARPTAAAPAAGPAGPVKHLAEAEFLPPMLAQPTTEASVRPGGPLSGRGGAWLLEPKFDGLRCIAVRNDDRVTLFSRNRLSFNDRFPTVAKALARLPAPNFVLDGEVVGLSGARPDFAALQQGKAAAIEYAVFDMPWLLGKDLRHLPIEDRKRLLAQTVEQDEVLKVVSSMEGEPHELFEEMCRKGWEGLVAKRSGSPYREGRSGDWLKLKCTCRQEFVVGGFTPPSGSRTGFGALLLGYWQDGELVYAGKVGTGFSEATLGELTKKLAQLERSLSPFSSRVAEKGARWVAPQLVAEVAFSNWTLEGRLRHPSFLGLRPDKASEDVAREPCGPRKSGLGAGHTRAKATGGAGTGQPVH